MLFSSLFLVESLSFPLGFGVMFSCKGQALTPNLFPFLNGAGDLTVKLKNALLFFFFTKKRKGSMH